MKSLMAISGHCIGKRHIEIGQECEDYSCKYQDETVTICAVSDGHGDKNCFRSKIGAELACKAVIDVIVAENIQNTPIGDIEKQIKDIELLIIEKWNDYIYEHIKELPISENEISSLDDDVQNMYRKGFRYEKAYGCTLIVAAMTSNLWFALQIGDGSCVATYDDGVYVNPILSDDEGCVGNHSTSLCNTNAIEQFRHYYSAVLPLSVYIFSDGIEESFDEMGLYKLLYSISYWVQEEGDVSATNRLNELLPQISEGGSGDDVSLAGIISIAEKIQQPKQTISTIDTRVQASINKYFACFDVYKNAIESLAVLTEKTDEMSFNIEQIKATLLKLQTDYDNLMSKQSAASTTANAATNNLNLAYESVQKAKVYKQSANDFWKPKFEKLEIIFDGESFDYSNIVTPAEYSRLGNDENIKSVNATNGSLLSSEEQPNDPTESHSDSEEQVDSPTELFSTNEETENNDTDNFQTTVFEDLPTESFIADSKKENTIDKEKSPSIFLKIFRKGDNK